MTDRERGEGGGPMLDFPSINNVEGSSQDDGGHNEPMARSGRQKPDDPPMLGYDNPSSRASMAEITENHRIQDHNESFHKFLHGQDSKHIKIYGPQDRVRHPSLSSRCIVKEGICYEYSKTVGSPGSKLLGVFDWHDGKPRLRRVTKAGRARLKKTG